jgi:hypothetical protein
LTCSREDEIQGNESELNYLRLQLKGIEVQCMAYIPEDEDPELLHSIRTWKADWNELRNKWAARKQTSYDPSSAEMSASQQ